MTRSENASAARPLPFAHRDFRLQWSGDLATALAFEMETLILAWFVLTETASVL